MKNDVITDFIQKVDKNIKNYVNLQILIEKSLKAVCDNFYLSKYCCNKRKPQKLFLIKSEYVCGEINYRLCTNANDGETSVFDVYFDNSDTDNVLIDIFPNGENHDSKHLILKNADGDIDCIDVLNIIASKLVVILDFEKCANRYFSKWRKS